MSALDSQGCVVQETTDRRATPAPPLREASQGAAGSNVSLGRANSLESSSDQAEILLTINYRKLRRQQKGESRGRSGPRATTRRAAGEGGGPPAPAATTRQRTCIKALAAQVGCKALVLPSGEQEARKQDNSAAAA